MGGTGRRHGEVSGGNLTLSDLLGLVCFDPLHTGLNGNWKLRVGSWDVTVSLLLDFGSTYLTRYRPYR